MAGAVNTEGAIPGRHLQGVFIDGVEHVQSSQIVYFPELRRRRLNVGICSHQLGSLRMAARAMFLASSGSVPGHLNVVAGSPPFCRRTCLSPDMIPVLSVPIEPHNVRSIPEGRRRMPDIFFAGVFSWGGYHVVGIGRDLEHRKRAACTGLAILH